MVIIPDWSSLAHCLPTITDVTTEKNNITLSFLFFLTQRFLVIKGRNLTIFSEKTLSLTRRDKVC